jgi:hypothetical protein
MAEAKGKSSTQRKEELPLDSPNWIRVEETLRALAARLGAGSAAKDLRTAMQDGLPSMERYLSHRIPPDRDRRLVPADYWFEGWFDLRADGSCVVNEGGASQYVRVRGREFYVWRPALAKVWPDVFASTSLALTADSGLITNPRGAGTKQKFDREFILTEAAAYVVTDDLPRTLEKLVHALQSTLGDKMPKDTQGKAILGPFFKRMKRALGR